MKTVKMFSESHDGIGRYHMRVILAEYTLKQCSVELEKIKSNDDGFFIPSFPVDL